MKKFPEFFRPLIDPNNVTVVFIDRKITLIYGTEYAFPGVYILIYLWNINQNGQIKVRSHFEMTEERDESLSLWRSLYYSRTEDEYNEKLKITKEQIAVAVF